MPAKRSKPSSSSSSIDLYEILKIPKDATTEQIRKSYYRLALLHHPDRATGSDEESNTAFLQIGRAYEILSDPSRRRVYDETGIDDDQPSDGDWAEYFRELFKSVTLAGLDDFKATYVGSVEEYEDILASYVKNRGDIQAVTDSIFFGDVDSENRYLAIIKRAIERGIVPQYDKITKIISDESAFRAQQRKRKKKAVSEAKQAAQLAKELGLGEGRNNLISKIQERQQGRFDALIANLEAKYDSPPAKRKKIHK